MATPTSLVFTVQKCEPELVAPAKPTPCEYKQLSDIDDQESFRFQTPILQFYRYCPSMERRDPVKVIKEALAQTLVFYYPFAGRLREGPGRKLIVHCTGEGVMFIEADADVTLEQFGDPIQPPFPCLEEIEPGPGGILDSPLLLIQVTRLKCGGFILSFRLNHTMSDAIGFAQFMNAIGEMARGANAPSILPVWHRELLNARDPPHVTCTHHEYNEVTNPKVTIIPLDKMAHRSFLFGPKELSTISKFIPPRLHPCSTFEILTACLWRCCTIALKPDPSEEVRIQLAVNARTKFNPALPIGYYGNVVAFPAALTTARKLCQNPLSYAVELLRKAKAKVTQEYIKSLADFMVIKDRPHFRVMKCCHVSDLKRVGFGEVDYGWGKAIFGGPPKGWMGDNLTAASLYVPFKSKKGEHGIMMIVSLPSAAMERFAIALDNILKEE